MNTDLCPHPSEGMARFCSRCDFRQYFEYWPLSCVCYIMLFQMVFLLFIFYICNGSLCLWSSESFPLTCELKFHPHWSGLPRSLDHMLLYLVLCIMYVCVSFLVYLYIYTSSKLLFLLSCRFEYLFGFQGVKLISGFYINGVLKLFFAWYINIIICK